MGNERMERKITIEEHVLYKEDYQMLSKYFKMTNTTEEALQVEYSNAKHLVRIETTTQRYS